ncbi:unnamed protein product [Fusarium graminearum]|uniref:Uncharacterized protein n=1 Tax=Fusarium austroamericanum TaxID=282268 RepID=A0AAN5YYF9_FUSAU|nr:hypothetical protein FAUST_11677 [Fusarium austroamericanum]PCD24050.1 hypothetical protein FGRA07_11493 [Fusarium graminearum]CAG2006545.1 unnamed protein product [Fusarium graminearum]
MKFSLTVALSASLLAVAAPTPPSSELTKKAEAESFFIQTDVGWFDGGDKKRAPTEKKSSVEKREPAENVFLQTDVGWFDGGDKKRATTDDKSEA